MNFATYDFWRLLFLCYLGSRFVIATTSTFFPAATSTISKTCLLITALILLGSESVLTLACFLWVVAFGWFSLILQELRIPKRTKMVIWLSLLIAQLAPLFYHKYWNFVFNDVFGWDVRIPSIIIPMGLSFYTFQTIGFWVDNLRSPQPRPALLDFLNFSSFFPQIVAGPIEKRDSLLPQIQQLRYQLRLANLKPALQWIILGFAYKLIVADNIGNLSIAYQLNPSNAWHVWFECLTFGIRIYFDFAGYSFIAVGLALAFGVRLTLNFRCPYWARDLREFWRNWHITLGAWLRDYVYLPLGGNRVRWWYFNVLAVFVVSGIWHGAGWGFLIWGFLHGVGVAVCSLRGSWIRPAPVSWILTFVYTTATWLFFFERDPSQLLLKSAAMLNPFAYSFGNAKALIEIFPSPADFATMGMVLVIAISALILEGIGIYKDQEPYRISRKPLVSYLSIFLIILVAPMEESSFIYFNF